MTAKKMDSIEITSLQIEHGIDSQCVISSGFCSRNSVAARGMKAKPVVLRRIGVESVVGCIDFGELSGVEYRSSGCSESGDEWPPIEQRSIKSTSD